MIINPSYKAELREAIRQIDEVCFTKDQKGKILSNDDLLDSAAFGFQKDVEDYGCDYDWSLNEALIGLGINLSQAVQPDAIPDVVKTPVGNLLIEKITDPEHPGVQITLENHDLKMWLAAVAYDPAVHAIRMDTFGKLYPPEAAK